MFTILYVDDEQSLLDVGKIFLERGGQFSVDTIRSAEEALALLERKRYDAVIADYQMPGMDGIKFLKMVRGSGSTVPFILFTGRGREEVVIQALNEGADFYLQKGGDTVSQFAELSHQVRQAVQRRMAEASLRDLEQREEQIINFLPDPTVAIDTDGIIIAWNRAMEEMTGIAASAMLGRGNYEYALPFYGERRPVLIDLLFLPPGELADKYSGIVRNGSTIAAETSCPVMKGESRTLWGKAGFLYDGDGKIVGAIESIRDITERKAAEAELIRVRDELEERVEQRTAALSAANLQLQKEIDERKKTEAALQESEARYRTIVEQDYRSILENIQDVFYRTDAEGKLTLVSPSGAAMLGYGSTDEITGRFASEFYADPKEFEVFRAAFLRDGTVTDMEITLKRKDGSPITVSTNGHTYNDTNGNYAGVEGVFRDITRMKQVQDELRQSEEQYRVLVAHIQDGAFLSQDGLLLYCNDALGAMAGYPKENMIGKQIPDLIAPEDRGMVMERQRRRLAGERLDESYGFMMLHSDGTTRIPVMMSVGIGTYRGRPAVIGTVRDLRKEREREQELRESGEKYRMLVETSFDGILIHQDGVVVYANATAARTFGVSSADEIVGRTALSLIHPDYRGIVRRRMAGAMEKTQPVIEEKFVRADGSTVDTEVAARPFTWKGRPAVHVVFRDVTARTRAEEALKAKEAQQRQIIDLVPHMIFAKDYDGKYLLANRAVAEGYNTTVEALEGRSHADFHSDKEELRRMLADDREVMDSGRTKFIPEESYLDADGKHRYLQTTKVPFEISGTGRKAVLGIAIDITEHRRIETELRAMNEQLAAAQKELRNQYESLAAVQADLRESGEKYRALVENSFDGIMIQQDGMVVYANTTAVRLLGGTVPEDLIGRQAISFIHPDYRPVVRQRMVTAARTAQPVITEKFIRIDGRAFEVDVATTPFAWNGRPAVHVVFRDIMDRRRAEDSLLQANRKLNLLSSVTRHDIINQLSVLKGFFALARITDNPAKLREFLQKQDETIARIEREILFTKEYQDIGTVAPVWMNAEECVRETAGQFDLSGIRIAVEGLSGIELYADPLLAKVCFNLIENAIRYGGENLSVIRFSARIEDGGLVIACEDDGPGVPAEEKTLIFERGYGKNTGYGLFLIKEILAITGMTIAETGEPGKGARFEISVPKAAFRCTGGM